MASRFKRTSPATDNPLNNLRNGDITPIYLEPIAGSKERFTVILVIRLDGLKPKIYPVLNETILRCLFGEMASNISGFIQLIAPGLQTQAEANEKLSPILSGFYVGKTIKTRAKSMMDAANNGTSIFSAFQSPLESELELQKACKTILDTE